MKRKRVYRILLALWLVVCILQWTGCHQRRVATFTDAQGRVWLIVIPEMPTSRPAKQMQPVEAPWDVDPWEFE